MGVLTRWAIERFFPIKINTKYFSDFKNVSRLGRILDY